MKIQEGQVVTTAKNTKSKSEDDEDALEEHECQEDEEEHLTGIRQTVLDKIRCVIQSPMTCTIYANWHLLPSFKVKMLKEICSHFVVQMMSFNVEKLFKADRMGKKIEEMAQGCSCNTELT